jgi:2-polyprenyl-3-methyl-5-hydroxy-6-metoxy-1,4-benzoquinol methylase
MTLSPTDIHRLEEFLTRLSAQTYPEPPSQIHHDVTAQMIAQLPSWISLPAGAAILDVGCGQGVAMERFVKLGFSPIGITINPTDLAACRAKGFDVRELDQSFLTFEDQTFDLVWCRHCLEHSPMPYFTLTQLVRVLKPGGGLYVEVPAADTAAQHQTNRNHYSLLPKSAWGELITRAGIIDGRALDIRIQLTQGGDDLYWAFLGRRASQIPT